MAEVKHSPPRHIKSLNQQIIIAQNEENVSQNFRSYIYTNIKNV